MAEAIFLLIVGGGGGCNVQFHFQPPSHFLFCSATAEYDKILVTTWNHTYPNLDIACNQLYIFHKLDEEITLPYQIAIDLFHNGGLLMCSFTCMIISLSDLV